MKKEFWLIIILGIIIVVLGAIALWPAGRVLAPQNSAEGIQIFSPEVNEEVFSPLKITGVVNGGGWAGFEGQVGTAELLDDKGVQLGSAVLTATTDWTNSPVNFETYLNFQSDADKTGALVFHNENPSGLSDKNKEYVLPVKIKISSGEIMKIKVYFNNNQMDPEVSCNKVFAVGRDIPKIEAVGSAALWQLLFGPTQEEKNAGFYTSINQGVTLKGLAIDKNGTATADFDSQLENGVGGSCKVSAIRAQITQTLKQFPTIKNVVISIDGRTEDILQP